MQQVAHLEDIAADRGTEIKLGDETLILVRDGGTVRAFEGKCPHAGAPLAKGAVCDGFLICPWHKAAFAVSTGALAEPPALNGLASYRTEVRDGAVFVDPVKQPAPTRATAPDERHVVILGAGAAGTACAAALREFGFGGAVTMVGAEPDEPYDRTALSKFVLEGGKAPDEVATLRPDGFYAEHRIERVHAGIAALEPTHHRVSFTDGQQLDYAVAVVATGGTPLPLDVPGADLDGVFTLRSKADSAAIVAQAEPGGRAVILGGSFIGLEAASALRKRGMEVAVVSPEEVPFGKQFGPEIGAMFRRLHERNGAKFHAGTKATRLTGEGAVDTVLLETGERLPADLVVVGIGVRPATFFVEDIALEKDGGISVDAGMRAAPDVYAVGDVAHFPFDGGTARIEHWRLAQQHARVAARNIVGEAASYGGVPFFWTYHVGKRFEYLGHATQWDEVIVEGVLGEHDFVALYVAGGTVAAVLACQRERATCLLLPRLRSGLTADQALQIIRSA